MHVDNKEGITLHGEMNINKGLPQFYTCHKVFHHLLRLAEGFIQHAKILSCRKPSPLASPNSILPKRPSRLAFIGECMLTNICHESALLIDCKQRILGLNAHPATKSDQGTPPPKPKYALAEWPSLTMARLHETS
ncbi:unnamed protein product [Prunus armeniaca]|uniref:Uncharacterized protein n=1 Tax=Prunus armeniaca TaxID=36596 RepID=A0A6J5VC21_PRUAR|nr:unnamed protein product [Prunus armeniaca]